MAVKKKFNGIFILISTKCGFLAVKVEVTMGKIIWRRAKARISKPNLRINSNCGVLETKMLGILEAGDCCCKSTDLKRTKCVFILGLMFLHLIKGLLNRNKSERHLITE